jgi:tetrahydromethanopterin S-methyltransferase subunit E
MRHPPTLLPYLTAHRPAGLAIGAALLAVVYFGWALPSTLRRVARHSRWQGYLDCLVDQQGQTATPDGRSSDA